MPKYEIAESDRFLKDVEEAAVWILLSNIEQSEDLAEKKVNELGAGLDALKKRLRDFPESGETSDIEGIRGFPVYDGRYSVQWIVNHAARTVTLLTLADSKHPKELRQFHFDE